MIYAGKKKQMKELNPNKPVQLRDGRQVRNVCWDFRRLDGSICISGIVACETYDLSMTWCKDGRRYADSQFDKVNDLINVPERIERWVNVYGEGAIVQLHETKEMADKYASKQGRIACIKISFTVGEGLE